MSAAVCTESADCPSAAGQVLALRRHLRALGREEEAADTAVTTCLMWVAGVLVRVALDLADPRSAGALMDEASAVLASAPVPAAAGPHPAPSLVEPLTSRQLAVLRRLEEEVSLRQIADGMYVSYNTVKSHTRAVYRKLGAGSRAEAVLRGRELGLM
ncbi:helix-turn-helix transcriptional regulator [Streptomyces silaceus]|uniref:helix-turn-helix transcriptional regulator n=1 Tax=Streptomyces silaceus TaxID=545123 RepID=UPI000ADF6593|nr:LuxR C-terminal-related transcriptional regulator [Streptomyces silaceus]